MTPFETTHLFLLRHAHSSWAVPGERDHSRTLDRKGRAQAERLSGKLAPHAEPLRHIVCSSARRARETLDGIRSALPRSVGVEFKDELYAEGESAYRDAALRHLASGATLLIGHNPTISDFAASLLHSDPEGLARLENGYGTACWAAIAVPLGPGRRPDLANARLESWIEP